VALDEEEAVSLAEEALAEGGDSLAEKVLVKQALVEKALAHRVCNHGCPELL